ncbi:hypothetical protein V5O48_013285 [Marasmius crinis-equi]|uniref:Uncharacterized protein n=1 Tax=Marasmius crinis-equi TaxID=585013 RepID=A0ABR3F0H7_9AGAR
MMRNLIAKAQARLLDDDRQYLTSYRRWVNWVKLTESDQAPKVWHDLFERPQFNSLGHFKYCGADYNTFRDISPAEPSPFFSLQLPVPPTATADLVHHTDAFIRAASPPTSHSASLSALKTLRVKDVVLSSPTVRLLSKLNGVQALDLSTSQTLTPFLEELGQCLGTEERFPFPSLVLLNLRNFAFGLNPPDIPNELKIRMLESLSARINRGRGIIALTLESCEGFLEEEIDVIREIVPGFEQV